MKRAALGALLALTLLVSACEGTTKPPPSTPRAVRDVVRIGVFMSPDPAGSTYGAAATRSLIYPQLFRATPAGRWSAGVVAPGSDRTARDAKSATFRLRRAARWSDGTRITAADLRRTLDPRFVQSVDDATRRGTIQVHFTNPLPGWRRLWSGLDVIGAANEGVFGGPFTLASQTAGLETILTRNSRYYGPRPSIREVHLVVAPDSEIAARLLERGELDVIAPLAFSARTARLRRIRNAHVVGVPARGGWTAAIVANPARLSQDRRAALFALVDRKRFTDVLLRGEAVAAGPSTAATLRVPESGATPAISAPVEAPELSLLLQSMQRLGRDRGIALELRQADFDQVLRLYAASDFDVLVRIQPTTPVRCWVCEAGSVNQPLAIAADSGDKSAATQLKAQLESEALVLDLWQERSVVAARKGLGGVTANGFAVTGPAWDIPSWRWNS